MYWKDAVREWLEREMRSQAFLAREARIDATYLSLCLNDRRNIGYRALRKLERAMGMDAGELAQIPMLVGEGED